MGNEVLATCQANDCEITARLDASTQLQPDQFCKQDVEDWIEYYRQTLQQVSARQLDKLTWRWRDGLIIFASIVIVGVIKLWEWI